MADHNKNKNVNQLLICLETVALIGTIVALIYITIHQFK